MPYELVVDGPEEAIWETGAILLSPQDLAAVEEIPELVRLGVISFKIEGRLKTPEYVAAVTQVYRSAIDRAWTDQGSSRPPGDGPLEDKTRAKADPLSEGHRPTDRYQLEMAFSRGLYSGWMHGVNHQRNWCMRDSAKSGAHAGGLQLLCRRRRTYIEVRSRARRLRPGDGSSDRRKVKRYRPVNKVAGVYEVKPLTAEGAIRLAFEYMGRSTLARLRQEIVLWKTGRSRSSTANLRKSWSAALAPVKPKRSLDLVVSGRAGEPLQP